MDVIVERCAGLDVHRDSVVATVRVPGTGKSRRRRAQQTRTFGTTIAQLELWGVKIQFAAARNGDLQAESGM